MPPDIPMTSARNPPTASTTMTTVGIRYFFSFTGCWPYKGSSQQSSQYGRLSRAGPTVRRTLTEVFWRFVPTLTYSLVKTRPQKIRKGLRVRVQHSAPEMRSCVEIKRLLDGVDIRSHRRDGVSVTVAARWRGVNQIHW